MNPESPPPRLMLVSDLDHTMVDHHDPDNKSILRFNALWAAEYSQHSLLVYSTGRSPTLYKELRKQKPMLTPGITILSVGTEIAYGDGMIPDSGWERELDKGWNRSVIVEVASGIPELTFQSATEQRPHKVSFSVDKAQATQVIQHLRCQLEARGLKVKLIYSGGQDLDVLPVGAGKGHALSYLLAKFEKEGKSPLKTFVCGDSGNDVELFAVPNVYGVMVGNALEELVQWYNEHAKDNPRIYRAIAKSASGILEAMQHFDFQPNISPRDAVLDQSCIAERAGTSIPRELVLHNLLCEQWLKGEVENSADVFKLLKSHMASGSAMVAAWGADLQLGEAIEMLYPLHGLHKGRKYWIWVDRIQVRQLTPTTWLAKFDKWQHLDGKLECRITTAILQHEDGRPFPTALQVQETWKEGFAGKSAILEI